AEFVIFFFSSRRRHTRSYGDWSSDVCSSDLPAADNQRGSGDDRRRGGPPSQGLRPLAAVVQDAQLQLGVAVQRPRAAILATGERSEERRVGKEGRSRGGECAEREM